MEKHICCICGKEFEGYGNNPDPVKQEGRCCDICNNIVILERIRLASLINIIGNKVKNELIEANEKSGAKGINEVLTKYNFEDLMIKEN